MNPKPFLAVEEQAAKVLAPFAEEALIVARGAAARWAEDLGFGAARAAVKESPEIGAAMDHLGLGRVLQDSKRISDELEDLVARSAKGDATALEVQMSDGQAISALPNACANIFTRGLGGCYATAVDIQSASGARQLVLTHYPIVSESRANINKLIELVPDDPKARTFTTIFAPDTYDILGATHEAFVRNVGMITRSGERLKIEPYPMLGDLSARDYGSIRFNLPPALGQPIRYKTWFSQGKIE